MRGEAGVRAAAKGIENRMGPGSAGQRKVLEAIERDQMTPQKVQARLRALGPQATLADAGGENLTGLARSAAGVPGPAKNRAAMTLNARARSEEHTSELQSLMRISYAVFCLKKKNKTKR